MSAPSSPLRTTVADAPAAPAWTALLRPTVSRFRAIADAPGANAWTAAAAVFACGFAGALLAALPTLARGLSGAQAIDPWLIAGVAFSAAITMAGFVAFTACLHTMASLMKQSGGYHRLAHTCAAFSAPLALLAGLAALVGSGVLLAVIYLFWILLYAIALRAVTGMSPSKTAVVLIASLLGVLGLGILFALRLAI